MLNKLLLPKLRRMFWVQKYVTISCYSEIVTFLVKNSESILDVSYVTLHGVTKKNIPIQTCIESLQ
jgi:hypothetical protein